MSRRHASSSRGGGPNLGLIVIPMLDMSFQLLAFFIMVYSPNTSEDFIGGPLETVKSVETTPKDEKPVEVAAIPDKTLPDLPPNITPKLEQDFVVVLKKYHPVAKFMTVGQVETEEKRIERWKREKEEREKEKKDLVEKEAEEAVWAYVKVPSVEITPKKEEPGKEKKEEVPAVRPPRPAENIVELEDFVERDKKIEARKDPYKTGFEDLEKLLKKHFEFTSGRKPKSESKGAEKKEDDVIKTKIKIEADPGIQFEFVIRAYAACKKAGFDEVSFTTPLD